MLLDSTIGSIFNCGFCRTVVYEYLAEKREDMQMSKDSQSKPSESKESASVNGKVCVSDHFRTLFCGPQFEVGDGYFDQGKSSRESKFERHVTKCRKPLQDFAL